MDARPFEVNVPQETLDDLRERLGRTRLPDAFEEAAAYLKKSPKAFERVVARGEIPKHYLTERGIRFSRKELDGWLIGH